VVHWTAVQNELLLAPALAQGVHAGALHLQVVLQLNALLRLAHENGLVLRDVALDNVVFAQLQMQRGWTLREFTSSTKAGKVSQHAQARRTPPEARAPLLLLGASDVSVQFCGVASWTSRAAHVRPLHFDLPSPTARRFF
jgi:hypothetical protein